MRWYDDACGTAWALELVGERWALLIIRELMFGPRRFGELRNSLRGLSANILTQRLDGLIETGIVKKGRLMPPASSSIYELTPWGYESEPIFQTMGRWAARSPGHDATLPLSAASLMLSFRTMHSPERAAGLDVPLGFEIADDAFCAHLTGTGITIRRAQAGGDLVLSAPDATIIAAAVYAGIPIAELESQGALKVRGDRVLAERFVTLFPLPPKVEPA